MSSARNPWRSTLARPSGWSIERRSLVGRSRFSSSSGSRRTAATRAMMKRAWIGTRRPCHSAWTSRRTSRHGPGSVQAPNETRPPLDPLSRRHPSADRCAAEGLRDTVLGGPASDPRGDTRTISTLIYPGDLRAVVHANHENLSGHTRAEFRVDGTGGTIRGTLGLMYDYPRGRPDTLEIWSIVLPTDGWLSYPVTTRWILTRSSVPCARCWPRSRPAVNRSERSRQPRHARIIEALYRSGETGDSQPIIQ